MDSSSPVGLTLEGAVARLTLDRRARHNAADATLVEALGRHLDTLAGASAARVLVLQGQPGAFCAGWDIDDLLRLAALDDAAITAEFARNERVLTALETFPGVTIAAVDGSAYGFGLSLVARCDLVVASERATFCAPELALGLAPVAILRDLRRTIGRAATMQWLVDGAPRSAAAARDAGLVGSVCSEAGFAAHVAQLAAQAARLPAGPARRTKEMLRALDDLSDEAAKSQAVAAGVAALRTAEAQALIAAAAARRRGTPAREETR